MMRSIMLKCACGRRKQYSRSADPVLPANVVTIETTFCDRCDNGGFGSERWLDSEDREISQEAAS